MITECSECGVRYDDQFRLTICPHNTFAANDGLNNFKHHPESFIETKRVFSDCTYCPQCDIKLQENHCKLICPVCQYYMSCSDFY